MVYRRFPWLLLALCCLSGGWLTRPAQAQSPTAVPSTPPHQAQSLESDARLNGVISLETAGISLQDLLKQVSHTPLTLTPDRSCAEQKIQLRLQQRPLRTLMQALADLLPGTWEPLADKSGYVLRMSSAAVRRRQKWWELFLQEREQALAAQRQAVLQALRTPPYRRKPNDPNPEHSNLAIEAEIASEQDFFNALSPDLQERIANNLNDLQLMSTRIDLGFCEEEAVQVSFGELPPAARDMLQKHPSIQLFATRRDIHWDDVMVRFNNTGNGVMCSIALSNGDATSTQTLGGIPLIKAPTLSFNSRMLAEAVRKLGKSAPDTWKQLMAFQQSRVWPNAAPQHLPRQMPPPHRPDMLRQLSAQYDIDFVADYYSVPGYPIRPLIASNKPAAPKEADRLTLQTKLDDEAALHDLSWKQQPGGLYLFRNNRWYRDDLLEAPAAVVHRLTTGVVRPDQTGHRNWKTVWTPDEIRTQIDWEAEVVSSLNLWQISNGLQWTADEDYLAAIGKNLPVPDQFPDLGKSFPYGYEPTRILREYHVVSFYAGLNAEQRSTLIAARLPFAVLTPVQQQQAIALVPRLRTLLSGGRAAGVVLGLYSNIGKELLGPNNMPGVRLVASSSSLQSAFPQ